MDLVTAVLAVRVSVTSPPGRDTLRAVLALEVLGCAGPVGLTLIALVRSVQAILLSVTLILRGNTLQASSRHTFQLSGRAPGARHRAPVLVCSTAGLQILVEAGAVPAAAGRTLRGDETEVLAGQLRARVVSAGLSLAGERFDVQQLGALSSEDDAGVTAQVVSHDVGRGELGPVENISTGGDCQAVRSDEQVVTLQNSFSLVSSVVKSLYLVGEGVTPVQTKLVIIHS